MSDSRIKQKPGGVQNQGGTPGSNQVPEVYDPEKLGRGELTKVITLGEGGQISAGLKETFYTEHSALGIKGWHNGEVVFDLNNQGLRLTGDITARSGTFSGTISIGEGASIFKADLNGISLGSDKFDEAPFRVTPQGQLFATDATLTGTVTGMFIGASQTALTGPRVKMYVTEAGYQVIDFFASSSAVPSRITVSDASAGFSALVVQSAPTQPSAMAFLMTPTRFELGLGISGASIKLDVAGPKFYWATQTTILPGSSITTAAGALAEVKKHADILIELGLAKV